MTLPSDHIPFKSKHSANLFFLAWTQIESTFNCGLVNAIIQSFISWWSVLFAEDTGIPVGNNRPTGPW